MQKLKSSLEEMHVSDIIIYFCLYIFFYFFLGYFYLSWLKDAGCICYLMWLQ